MNLIKVTKDQWESLVKDEQGNHNDMELFKLSGCYLRKFIDTWFHFVSKDVLIITEAVEEGEITWNIKVTPVGGGTYNMNAYCAKEGRFVILEGEDLSKHPKPLLLSYDDDGYDFLSLRAVMQ